LQRAFISEVLEDILTKRPYSQYLSFFLLKGDSFDALQLDLSKLTRHCLRTLSAEDLMQLAHNPETREDMKILEARYSVYDVEGTSIDSDLAKIIFRFVNEAKPI